MNIDPLTVCCQHLAKSQTIIEAKNAEIAQLKEAIRRLAAQDATLTTEEREAIEWAAKWISITAVPSAGIAHCHAESLCKLLERLK